MRWLQGKTLRTDTAILISSAVLTLIGAFIVVYGPNRVLRARDVVEAWYWHPFIIAIGVCGLLAMAARGAQEERRRLAFGAVALLAPLGYLLISLSFGFAVSAAFSLTTCLVYVVAFTREERAHDKTAYDLSRLHAAAFLGLLGPSVLAMAPDPYFGVPSSWYLLATAVGAGFGLAHLIRPGSAYDRAGGFAAAAAFAALAVVSFRAESYITMITAAPFLAALLTGKIVNRYEMGVPRETSGLEAEDAAVRRFEGVAELVAWSTFLITYMHLSLEPSFIAYDDAVFFLFICAFAIFAYQYRMRPDAPRTFTGFYRSSLVNAILLAAVGHMTGGLQSPYNWFFVFILFSGSISPFPAQILVRLAVIIGYYVFETAYFAYHGFFTREIAVNHLMQEVFILGLTGIYAYHLSLSRRAFDLRQAATNEEIRAALERERKAAQLAERQAADIAAAKRRDEALLASLADAVIGLEADGRITTLNPAAEGLLGLDQASAKGQHWRDMIDLRREDDPGFKFGAYLDSARKGNAIPLPENLYFTRANGTKTYVSGVLLPILDAGKKVAGIVATLNDVTYLREVDQMKTGFLSVAAHQLRTPLSTIRWYLELLNDPSEGKLKKNQKMFAENAYLSLRKMVGLVNRLLAVTRLEAGRVPFKPEPTDLRALTREIVDDLKGKLGERRLDMQVDIPALPTVPLDPTLAREVFANLIENAIRYTPDGGRIDVTARDEGEDIVWSVSDTGIGIPETQQERIFEKFYRAGNAVEHSSEGSGLGLYLAKFIVGTWNGRIAFESEEGEGSTFRVTVPKAGMRAKEGHVSLNA